MGLGLTLPLEELGLARLEVHDRVVGLGPLVERRVVGALLWAVGGQTLGPVAWGAHTVKSLHLVVWAAMPLWLSPNSRSQRGWQSPIRVSFVVGLAGLVGA